MSKKRRTFYDLTEREQAALEMTSPEELQAKIERDEKELAETQAALEKFKRWRESLPYSKAWEDLRVLVFELHDALDELNDHLRVVERNLAERRIRPGWVAFEHGALIWDGRNLLYDSGKGQWMHLLHTAKALRMPACEALPALFEELTRERPPV